MSLQAESLGPVPDETARIARAAFPKGNRWMQLRDVLGTVYDDVRFKALFASRGRPAIAPWRLALVTVMQFAEGLSDRQAAEAMRARIDWKYALGLELTDPGVDFSVLSEFRACLVHGSATDWLLEALLEACRTHGWLKARGHQRTDSTHVLGALRVLNRLELAAETLRAARNALATVAPEWLQTQAPPEWYDRYDRRVEDYRLPKGREAREAYAATVGRDGLRLLAALDAPTTPELLRELPAVGILRRVWDGQFVGDAEQVRWRTAAELPPATEQVESPYEPEARFSIKRQLHWVGYKVHLTETCDDDHPHLLTHVATTVATVPDVEQLAAIQQALADIALLPAHHVVDAGYVRAANLVTSSQTHQVDLVGPIYADRQWQAKAQTGFDVAHFQVDWDTETVTCPAGRTSIRWSPTATARGPMIRVEFAATDCAGCSNRPQCTRAKSQPRGLTLQPRAEHEAIQAARQRQRTVEFEQEYARRAGIEGTLSQSVRAFGLRQARYRGLAKTHLQHVATATAVNLSRIADWLNDTSRATTRTSRFAALALAG